MSRTAPLASTPPPTVVGPRQRRDTGDVPTVSRHATAARGPELQIVPGVVGRRYGLRGRHVRERGRLRPPVPLAVGPTERPEDRLVLQVLRRRAAVDLDAAQVGAAAALTPSITAPALDRLVRAGLVRTALVAGRERYGLP